jgi:hypothetical protein
LLPEVRIISQALDEMEGSFDRHDFCHPPLRPRIQ